MGTNIATYPRSRSSEQLSSNATSIDSIDTDTAPPASCGLFGSLLSLSLGVWFASYIIPFQAADHWDPLVVVGNFPEMRKWQYFGLGQFILLGFLYRFTEDRTPRNVLPIGFPSLLWGGLVAWCGASCLWSIDPSASFKFLSALILCLYSCLTFWHLPRHVIARSANFSCFAICASLCYLALILGFRERTLGYITANHLGSFGLVMVAISQLARRPFRQVFAVLGTCVMLYTQSRTLLVSAMLFLMTYATIGTLIRSRRSLYVVATCTVFAFPLGILVLPPALEWFAQASADAFGTVKERADSSMTGRTDWWDAGLRLLEGHEFLGYGYRTRRGLETWEGIYRNAHSGILNACLDIGLIGCGLYLITFLATLWKCLDDWAERRDPIDRVVASYLIGIVPSLIIEPNYLSFSGSVGLMLLFACSQLTTKPATAE